MPRRSDEGKQSPGTNPSLGCFPKQRIQSYSYHSVAEVPKGSKEGNKAQGLATTLSSRYSGRSQAKKPPHRHLSNEILHSPAHPKRLFERTEKPHTSVPKFGKGSIGLLVGLVLASMSRAVTGSHGLSITKASEKFACHVNKHRMNFVPANDRKRFGEVWRSMHRPRHNRDD